ncbi:MAG: fumarylacetoacetate hydrolase family protein [Pseudomonadota bacterium]
MNPFVFTAPPTPTLSIRGTSAAFPVRRVYCIGRNYAAHSIEMGGNPDREEPFFFQKNPDNLVQDGRFPYPPQTGDVHHEVEMVVALKSGGTDTAVQEALAHVYGYAIGLDMTRRDLQNAMKTARRPWEIAKAFEHSGPLSEIVPVETCGHPHEADITLLVNGEERQSSNTNQMIWKVPEMIAYLSRHYRLAAGDVIMTGTPAGVGPVRRGDVMVAKLEGVAQVEVAVV